MSFKKYDGSVWQAISPKQLKGIPYTGTLPATLTGTKAGYLHSYKIYGNTEQTGTPTPENPIVPSECGELETTGVHAGQYKLPLLSGSTPVDIYLGESQTTRRIKKLELTGEENWTEYASGIYRLRISTYGSGVTGQGISSHFISVDSTSAMPDDSFLSGENFMYVKNTSAGSLTGWKTYLTAQYANGTPVTIWYVLATEETGTLNEPLRKIGEYADTIDSTQTTAQMPTTAGSTTISWAGQGLAPSQFDSIAEWVDKPTYKRVNGGWVADN